VVESQVELIERAQAGDADALEALVASQQRYVYSIALGVMKNPADAADMTQEAFLRVIRALGTYRQETKLTTWLYRLVVNVCLDELRRRKRPIESLDGNGSWDDDEEPAPERVADRDRWSQPEAHAELRESAGELRRALDALATGQRLALTLHYFEDMSDVEIAQVMGVPVNTVKSHIHRGKAKLLALLGGPRNGTQRVAGPRKAACGSSVLRMAPSAWRTLGQARPLAAAALA
jgi:RNA polymerase sigma-70 factor (ECF subfamily)